MKTLTYLSPYAHWFLRAAIASVFIYHGVTKFPVLSGMAEMMGLPVVILFFVAVAETVGGAIVPLGGFLKDWMTRIGALMVIPVLLDAIFMVHWGQWNNFVHTESHPMGGMEFQVTLLLVALYLFVKGNGVKSSGYDQNK